MSDSEPGFESFDLDPRLQRSLAELGFDTPTPIQRDGIMPILEGRDVMATAMTGSGKTATFLLPLMHALLHLPRGKTRILVLAPTRELAVQIVQHFDELAGHTPLTAAAVYGGVGMRPQEKAFRDGVDVVVACPGRLLDHMGRGYANLADLKVLVLDEADRMLDMGFMPDVQRILDRLPKLEQTLLFSATIPPPIVRLSKRLLHEPTVINIERTAAPADGVRQEVFPVNQETKSRLLLELLRREQIESALVFTRTKHRADHVAAFLQRHDVACAKIHGDRTQAKRQQALTGFKKGRYRVLVATDVAARGIDIEALSHVINLDVPEVPDDYIHRVGRTARAGATGEALTFFAPQELAALRAIERALGYKLPRTTLRDFEYDRQPKENLRIHRLQGQMPEDEQAGSERSSGTADDSGKHAAGDTSGEAEDDRDRSREPVGAGLPRSPLRPKRRPRRLR